MVSDAYFVQCILENGNLLTSAWIEPKYKSSPVALRTRWTGRNWKWSKGWRVITCGSHYVTEEEITRNNLAYRTMLPIIFKNDKALSFGAKQQEN